ncbi:MAG: hypothetical protein JW807_06670 [Spirochaetes bacterium]|nr:hypothetical protein [Spirochaetota bacterium]
MKLSRMLSALLSLIAVSCGSVYTDSMNPLYNIPLPAFIRVPPPYSAIGIPDPSFGNNGTVVMSGSDFGYALGMFSGINAITIDKQGGILAVGLVEYTSGNAHMVLMRFSNDGRLDPEFGISGGYIIADEGKHDVSDSGYVVKTDSKDRIIVAGFRPGDVEGAPVAIWRFMQNGVLDLSFGINGCVMIQGIGSDVTPTWDWCYDMTVDDNDRIITTGFTRNIYMEFVMFVHRVTSRGISDTGFGNDGAIVLDRIAYGEDYVRIGVGFSVITEKSCNILVSGISGNLAGNGDIILIKIKNNGDLDKTFGKNGVIISDGAARDGSPGGTDIASDMIIDNQGNIFITGKSQNIYGDDDMVICKYDSQGMPELTYGQNGIVVSDGAGGVTSSDDYGVSLMLDNQQRIIIAGASQNSVGDIEMILWRYDSHGSLDTTFGNNGIVICDNVPKSTPGGIAMADDGKIIIGGSYEKMPEVHDMVIWKYK